MILIFYNNRNIIFVLFILVNYWFFIFLSQNISIKNGIFLINILKITILKLIFKLFFYYIFKLSIYSNWGL